MQVVHCLDVTAKCPVNGAADEYECEVRLDRFIRVEEIQKHCAGYRNKAILQETLTQELSDFFRAEVTTAGWHGDVRTTVTCHPKGSAEPCESSSAATPGKCGKLPLDSLPQSVFH